jgi:hypothetical protein
VKDFINSEWLLDRTGSEDARQIGLHSAPDVQRLTWTECPLLGGYCCKSLSGVANENS